MKTCKECLVKMIVPCYKQKLLKVNIIKDGDKIKKVYSIYTMIGFNYSYYHSILTFLYEWLSYVACVLTIVLFTINQRIFIEKDQINVYNDISHFEQVNLLSLIGITFLFHLYLTFYT